MIEVSIDSIRQSLVNYHLVVILKEKSSDRYLPIWIGQSEANAIAIKLEHGAVTRPLTHDLLQTMIDTLGAKVDFILVNDLKNDTFFAKITLKVDGKEIEVDSRPSDALALAVRVEVPIYVDESVMDKAGILLDKETGKPVMDETDGVGKDGKKVSEEELKKLSAFNDFIEEIDWGDFDKRQS